MIKFNPKEKMPAHNQYVLAFFPDVHWRDSSCKNDEHKWVVVKFIRGLSKGERDNLDSDDPRKKTYRMGDVFGLNTVPYEWKTFGPGEFYGHECTAWCELPTPLPRQNKKYAR